jgi:hypothetical protein
VPSAINSKEAISKLIGALIDNPDVKKILMDPLIASTSQMFLADPVCDCCTVLHGFLNGRGEKWWVLKQ